MPSSKLTDVLRNGGLALMLVATLGANATADSQHAKIRIALGRGEVITSDDDVKTVAIAEPKIADAAVGSQRTVVVNAKAIGSTSLVVYNEGGKFKVYDIEVYVPNADREVMLHVRVAEVTNDAKRELGFDLLGQVHNNVPWLDGLLEGGLYTTKVASPSIPLTIGPATDGFLNYERNDGKILLQTTWKALEEKGDIRTLASPNLMARSGEKASFLAGGEFPVPIATPNGNGATTITIQWREFGVKVEFAPTVEEDGTVTLKVAPEVSQLDFSNGLTLSDFRVPALISRKASTTVALNSGEYLVIGGLKQTEKTKVVRRVPILGQIPILGFFFTNTHVETSDKELMIIVSPEIIEAAATTLPKMPTDRPEQR